MGAASARAGGPGSATLIEKSIEVDGRAIRYAEDGSGPVLLVVHGGPGWRNNITPAVVDLATDHRVLAVEIPGFGTTSGAGIASMRDVAATLTAFTAAVAAPRYSVLGTSVGAIAALWAAIDHPECVDAIVLEAPAAFRVGVPRPSGPPPGADPPSPEQVEYMLRIIGPDHDDALVAAMPGCPVPALVLFGADDPLFPPRFAPEYERLAAVTVVVVPRAGHDIKGEQPEAFLAAVRRHLAGAAAGVDDGTGRAVGR